MKTTKPLWKNLTKKEVKHLHGQGVTSLRQFKNVAAKQAEKRREFPTNSEPCWDCRYIARKLEIAI